jgi:hypothetical protein
MRNTPTDIIGVRGERKMITFSVNGDRLLEDDLKDFVPLLKVLRENPNCDEHTRYAINKLVERRFLSKKKKFPKSYKPEEGLSYSNYGKVMEKYDNLNASRRQDSGVKIYGESLSDISITTPNGDFEVDEEVEINLDIPVLLGVFDTVEEHFREQGASFYSFIDAALELKVKIEDGFVVKDKAHADKTRKLLSEYGDCFEFLIPSADGTELTDEIILYMEQNAFTFFFQDVILKSRYLWATLRQKYG